MNQSSPKRTNALRPAVASDFPFVYPLIVESSGGTWPAVWSALALDGETVEASAYRYMSDASNELSLANGIIAHAHDVSLGALFCYQELTKPTGEATTASRAELPLSLEAALAPYRELTDPHSLFIAELGCAPEHRGKGVGTQFLNYAAKLATARGLVRLSLRVFGDNTGAVRLYERTGFSVVDERAVVAHPNIEYRGSVYLMVADVNGMHE